jgi:hypothetical protein
VYLVCFSSGRPTYEHDQTLGLANKTNAADAPTGMSVQGCKLLKNNVTTSFQPILMTWILHRTRLLDKGYAAIKNGEKILE